MPHFAGYKNSGFFSGFFPPVTLHCFFCHEEEKKKTLTIKTSTSFIHSRMQTHSEDLPFPSTTSRCETECVSSSIPRTLPDGRVESDAETVTIRDGIPEHQSEVSSRHETILVVSAEIEEIERNNTNCRVCVFSLICAMAIMAVLLLGVSVGCIVIAALSEHNDVKTVAYALGVSLGIAAIALSNGTLFLWACTKQRLSRVVQIIPL